MYDDTLTCLQFVVRSNWFVVSAAVSTEIVSMQLLLLPSFLGVLSNGTHLQYAAINSAVDLYNLEMVWSDWTLKITSSLLEIKPAFRKLSSILPWTYENT
ncbi:unnamed protein product [Citrullus colocynthis]|uniref:Uncharacterized protein n=1 Tax=Citrullus colocynthis TaxID=252529 RepID=A0ABP0Y507_9ROSI